MAIFCIMVPVTRDTKVEIFGSHLKISDSHTGMKFGGANFSPTILFLAHNINSIATVKAYKKDGRGKDKYFEKVRDKGRPRTE